MVSTSSINSMIGTTSYVKTTTAILVSINNYGWSMNGTVGLTPSTMILGREDRTSFE